MKKKVGIVSLGCPKNLVDTEIMLGKLKNKNYEVTNDESEADIIIVNTCGFIESAKQESINTILEMSHYKNANCELLIVTGCLSERYREEILKEIPEVDVCLGTGSYGDIVNAIEKQEFFDESGNIDYLENERLLSSADKGYAFIKIAEGCDNCCTYCIIPRLRGPYRSRKMEYILSEARSLAGAGIKEVILIAQDTTRYGVDIYKSLKLVDLISEISKIEGIEWIRLLYCYPELIDDRLIKEIETNEKVCKYIDVPVQHASDRILKSMGRRGDISKVEEVLEKLRNRVPEIVIRTSLIVGFPGEDENDFEMLYNYVKEFEFDRLGVFKYSREEDTPAAKMKEQVSRKLKEVRYSKVMSLQKGITDRKNHNRLDRTYKTLVEGVSEDGIFYYGRTYGEAPDIDGTVYFTSREPVESGSFVNVKILNTQEYDLIGEVEDEFTK